jgi:selenide,water dikinase
MKRLVLLGGGHAHVKVLADLADRPLIGWDVHLVTPYRRQIYSGMLPGWIAGHYSIDSCAIDLGTLAKRGAVALHATAGVALDAKRNELRCADGTLMRFDLLSIDTGPMPALEGLPGSAEYAFPLRPIEHFIAAWPALVDRILGRCRRFDLAIVGAGAAGVEVAFAIQHRAIRDGWSHLRIILVGPDALPLEGAPRALRELALTTLTRRGITWHGSSRATRIDSDLIVRDRADPLSFDACLVVTGAAAPAWPAASGLATDERGFIRVGPTLQSLSHSHVFAAGDVAAYSQARPKSGVYAVRSGPVLARNLRAACAGASLQHWTPQTMALYLISTGDRRAMGMWASWTWSGRWAWYLKYWIDRRFMRRFGTQTRG